ncbi:IclR family transcriptional regulator [Streptomyces sp. NPDC050804]|uniref:IclR family transcriptional regulator n=1 Tax=Streptomyces sp. NPDC050804 TaxID=3154745 RepID=UPI003415F6BE
MDTVPSRRFPTSASRSAEALKDTVEPAVTGTRSVFRALSILHAFSARQPNLSGREVAEKFGYSLPTAYRLLRALEAENFLVFDKSTRTYSPGPEILRLSGVMLQRDGVVAQTQSTLIRLRALTGETVGVFWRLGNQRTCTHEMVSPHPDRIEAGVGEDYPLTRGAAGKALLITLHDSAIRELVADPEVPDPLRGVDALLTELETSRRRGYTVSVAETVAGAVSIAAPIPWLQQGLAVCSITAPQSRFGPKEVETAGATLVEEMQRLRSHLGRRPAEDGPGRPFRRMDGASG